MPSEMGKRITELFVDVYVVQMFVMKRYNEETLQNYKGKIFMMY